MPPRGKTAPAEPVAETNAEANGAKDYTVYVEKAITASMQDFAAWLDSEVFRPAGTTLADMGKKDPVRLVALAGTLRMDFQRSDFNRDNRAKRAQERATEAEPETAPEPPKPARRGRPAAAASTTGPKPASGRRGRPAAAEPAAQPY